MRRSIELKMIDMYRVNVSFMCPSCDEHVVLMGVDMIVINTIIDAIATHGDYNMLSGMSHRCKLEALKFALLAWLDQDLNPVTIQETIQLKEIDHESSTRHDTNP